MSEFILRDREAGNEIERFNNEEDAILQLEDHEMHDKNDDCYTPNFYEIVEITEKGELR